MSEMRCVSWSRRVRLCGRHFNSKRHASLSSAALSSSLLQAHHISIFFIFSQIPAPAYHSDVAKKSRLFLRQSSSTCINCRIVGEVVLLKSKRDGFWTNGQFTPISAYFLIIPQFLHINKWFIIERRGIDLDMNEVINGVGDMVRWLLISQRD